MTIYQIGLYDYYDGWSEHCFIAKNDPELIYKIKQYAISLKIHPANKINKLSTVQDLRTFNNTFRIEEHELI